MDRTEVRAQIDRILRSRVFVNKGQLKRLLLILFENIDSQTTLKPVRVIRELWPEEAGSKKSADVATAVNRLRNALDAYYADEGCADPVVISLPRRSPDPVAGARELRWIDAAFRTQPEADTGSPAPETPSTHASEAVPETPSGPTAPPPRRKSMPGALWVAAGAALIALSALLAVHFFGVDRRPHGAALDGGAITIFNAEGERLWSKSFPEGFFRDYYEQGLATRMWFGDLDGRGDTSVLLLYHPAVSPLSHSTTLICYSDRGVEKWRWTPGRVLPELKDDRSTYTTIALGVLKAPARQPSRIVVSSWHQIFYPHQIAILDSTGRTLSEYWHSGHLDYLAIADPGGDGKQQIVASGISNGYNQATMVVLDADRASGASTEAARPELQLHGLGVAHEKLRLLFPRSDLNRALAVYNKGSDIMIEGNLVRVSVWECPLVPRCSVLYEFDRNFNLVSAVADDQLRSAHKEFYLNSKEGHPFSPEEGMEFDKIRCLAGCPGEFVPRQSP